MGDGGVQLPDRFFLRCACDDWAHKVLNDTRAGCTNHAMPQNGWSESRFRSMCIHVRQQEDYHAPLLPPKC